MRTVAGATFATAARARRGEQLIFRTVVPGSELGRPVRLSLSGGPAHALTVTARAGGGEATARVTSSSRRRITLTDLSYSCPLPPQATFCPARHETGSRHGSQLRFTARRGTLIQVVATVGPVGSTRRAHRTSGASVPAYRPHELVRVQAPPGGAASGPATLARSARARPGETAVMVTRLTGSVVGAPQTETITVPTRPARSLTVTSRVGRATSTATLRSAGSGAIALTAPRFTCTVAPVPSSCPVLHVAVSRGRDRLTFRSTPYAPVIALATVASR